VGFTGGNNRIVGRGQNGQPGHIRGGLEGPKRVLAKSNRSFPRMGELEDSASAAAVLQRKVAHHNYSILLVYGISAIPLTVTSAIREAQL
jgi:hypothetical protein